MANVKIYEDYENFVPKSPRDFDTSALERKYQNESQIHDVISEISNLREQIKILKHENEELRKIIVQYENAIDEYIKDCEKA